MVFACSHIPLSALQNSVDVLEIIGVNSYTYRLHNKAKKCSNIIIWSLKLKSFQSTLFVLQTPHYGQWFLWWWKNAGRKHESDDWLYLKRLRIYCSHFTLSIKWTKIFLQTYWIVFMQIGLKKFNENWLCLNVTCDLQSLHLRTLYQAVDRVVNQLWALMRVFVVVVGGYLTIKK